MNGPGTEPPQPRRTGRATVITIRVVLVAITGCTLGILGWVPMLRIAIITRKARDWAVFWAVLVAYAVLLTVVDKGSTGWNYFASTLVVLMGGLTIAYYLWFDIRHHKGPATPRLGIPVGVAPAQAFPPVAAPLPGPAYPPYAPQRQPQFHNRTAAPLYAPQPQEVPLHQHTPQPRHARRPEPPAQPPHPAPPPPQPQSAPRPPQRIDQVRAELDELSDFLRKEPRNHREQER